MDKYKKFLEKKEYEKGLTGEVILQVEKSKFIVLDVLIILISILYFIKYIILPHFGYPVTEFMRFSKIFKNQFKGVFIWVIYLLFLGFIITLFTFKEDVFKRSGLILLVSYITSILVAADMFVTAALVSGIAVYLYVRIMMSLELRNKKKLNKKLEDIKE